MPSKAEMAAGATQVQAGGIIKFNDAGDSCYGPVTYVEFGAETQFGESNIISVNDDDMGPARLYADNAQLRAGLVEGRNQLGRPVQVGDVIYVRYEGKEDIGGGKSVKKYAINVAAGSPQTATAATSTPTGAPAPADGDETPF